MSNLMPVPCTSTSPRYDREKHLSGSVVAVETITLNDRREMYALLRTYFSGTTRSRFEADLRDKESAILLRDAASGRIQGFSTFMRMEMIIDNANVVAFFSGDTIVEREFWGETILSRIWSQTIVTEAERIHAQHPETLVYWFLICSGYKTFRFLPVFFREFYPNQDQPTPARFRRLIDTLGLTRFGDEYIPESGVIRFRHPTPLRPGIADITRERLRDQRIAFFARMNPGHGEGDELACLTELSRANLTKAGMRMISHPA